jgi:hypothetical protein
MAEWGKVTKSPMLERLQELLRKIEDEQLLQRLLEQYGIRVEYMLRMKKRQIEKRQERQTRSG